MRNNGDVQNVYHYTSPEGIFSILSNKTLHFTHAQYLNDKHENIPNAEGQEEEYVFCTSLNSDNISMWNYYVKNNKYQGYNLGINVSEFTSRLEDAIYDSGIRLSHKKIDYDKSKTYKDLFSKQDAFSCEEEYRFVLTVPKGCFTQGNKKNTRIFKKYRVGDSGIITPYIEWKFKLNDKVRLFTQITLAPMIEAKLAENSFLEFLHTNVSQNITVKKSSVEMRF